MNVHGSQFLSHAKREAQRYGRDEFVFVRELVQNARDAGASEISFESQLIGGTYVLSCRDNGCGMDAHHLQSFLLKLYASDKGQHQLGMFGVGFWSILLFEPEAFYVDTAREEEHHLLHYQQGFDRPQLRRLDPASPGTTVILHRPAPQGDEWSATLLERLITYCGHVMTLQGENPDAPQALRLSFNGLPCNRPMAVQGSWVECLRHRHAFGLVGFGEQPIVRLYKGGILLREAQSLGELWPSRPAVVPKLSGLHPQIVVNCPNLNVLLDRRTIAEDAALAELMHSCEQALLTLSRTMLDAVAPLDLANALARQLRKNGPAWLVALLLFLSLPLSALLFIGNSQAPVPTPAITRVLDAYRGPRLDDPHQPPSQWDIRSEGPRRLQLVLGMAEHFDSTRGWLPIQARNSRPYPTIHQPADGAVSFQVSHTELPLLLPTPLLGSLLPGSVTLNGRPFGELRLSERGESLLFGAAPITGTLRYQFILGKTTLAGAGLPPSLQPAWPPELLPWLRGSENLMPAQWPQWFTRQLRGRFRPVEREMDLASDDWLSAVFSQDQADCDIMNGLLTLLLNAKGLDARLALGMVLEDGRPRGHLHAWTVYREHRRWLWQDASHPLPGFQHPQALSSPDPLAAGPPLAGPPLAGPPLAGPPLAGPPLAGPPLAGPPLAGPPLAGLPQEDELGPTSDSSTGSGEAVDPAAIPAGNSPILLVCGGVILLGLLGLICFFVARAARGGARHWHSGAGEWQFAAAWLAHSLRNGQDSAEILFRPLLRLANGAHISTHQLLRRAHSAPLFCGEAGRGKSPMLLDRTCPVLAAITSFLPELLDERLGFGIRKSGHARRLRRGEGALSLGEWEAGWQVLLPAAPASEGSVEGSAEEHALHAEPDAARSGESPPPLNGQAAP